MCDQTTTNICNQLASTGNTLAMIERYKAVKSEYEELQEKVGEIVESAIGRYLSMLTMNITEQDAIDLLASGAITVEDVIEAYNAIRRNNYSIVEWNFHAFDVGLSVDYEYSYRGEYKRSHFFVATKYIIEPKELDSLYEAMKIRAVTKTAKDKQAAHEKKIADTKKEIEKLQKKLTELQPAQ